MADDRPDEVHDLTDEDMTTTFESFQRLPAEIRIHIWSLAAFPRLLHVKIVANVRWPREHDVVCVQSSTSCPAILHVCQESRRHAPYEKAFTMGSEPRYIWTNFTTDMISIADWNYKGPALEAHHQDIQRLRITVGGDWPYDHITRWGDAEFQKYTALRELHLLDTDNVLIWESTYESPCWGRCPAENVRIIEEATGFMMTIQQIKMTSDFHLYLSFDGDGRVLDSDNLDEEIRDGPVAYSLTLDEIRLIE